MFAYRVVATNPLTGKQVASDWFDNELEAEAVMNQMKAEPDYAGYEYVIERKAVV